MTPVTADVALYERALADFVWARSVWEQEHRPVTKLRKWDQMHQAAQAVLLDPEPDAPSMAMLLQEFDLKSLLSRRALQLIINNLTPLHRTALSLILAPNTSRN
ncbi:MAG: hypothetical protein ACRYHA_23600 [Janthinobacterium lividum]